jgi:hypothetical protein
MARVLVIGDVHEPASHPGYFQFAKDTRKRWRCNKTIFIGDVLDFHSISFHASEPNADGPEREHALAAEAVKRWHSAFRGSTVLIGNHDERVARLAGSVNIPARFLRDYADLWNTPTWDWVRDTTIDGVHYLHGTGLGGQQPALNAARASMRSTVCGHVHSVAGVRWTAGPDRRIFGMDVGCGVDIDHPAMHYGRNMVRKPLLGCGVVIDGRVAHWLPMEIARGGKYHRSNFKKPGAK